MYSPAALLAGGEVFASTLLVLVIDRFGDSFLAGEEGPWTPETLRLEIKDHFGINLPDDNLGKLTAAIAVLTTDHFFRSLPSFLFTLHGLLGDGVSWSYAEPLDIEDLAWAMTEAIFLAPPQEGDLFDSQIVAYCKTMLKREGMLSPPSILTFAREEEAYGNITPYDEDIMREQADRTNAVNEYIEEQTMRLLQQIESIPFLKVSSSFLRTTLVAELENLQAKDQWR
jgi:hypothetical protein